jgi:hypothetical protein
MPAARTPNELTSWEATSTNTAWLHDLAGWFTDATTPLSLELQIPATGRTNDAMSARYQPESRIALWHPPAVALETRSPSPVRQ